MAQYPVSKCPAPAVSEEDTRTSKSSSDKITSSKGEISSRLSILRATFAQFPSQHSWQHAPFTTALCIYTFKSSDFPEPPNFLVCALPTSLINHPFKGVCVGGGPLFFLHHSCMQIIYQPCCQLQEQLQSQFCGSSQALQTVSLGV